MAKKEKEAKTGGSSLKDTLKSIRSKFGDEAIMMLNDKPNVGIDSLPTGSVGVDIALGIGGLPKGRIIEIFGPESSGKTTLALHCIAEAQKRGWDCAFIDAEHAMDPQYAKKLGVNTEKLLISQPSNGEEAMQIVDALVRSEKMGVIVVDSVASLTPKSEIEGEIGDVKIGALARLMSQSLRVLTGSIHKSNTIVIFINQIRMNISSFGFGANPETTSGGKALKFYSSVRIEIRRIGGVKKGEENIGSRVRVKILKNKVAVPFKQAEFEIIYGQGISREGEILEMGELCGIISKEGISYTWGDHKLGRGFEAARSFLKENPDMSTEIVKEIMQKQEA